MSSLLNTIFGGTSKKEQERQKRILVATNAIDQILDYLEKDKSHHNELISRLQDIKNHKTPQNASILFHILAAIEKHLTGAEKQIDEISRLFMQGHLLRESVNAETMFSHLELIRQTLALDEEKLKEEIQEQRSEAKYTLSSEIQTVFDKESGLLKKIDNILESLGPQLLLVKERKKPFEEYLLELKTYIRKLNELEDLQEEIEKNIGKEKQVLQGIIREWVRCIEELKKALKDRKKSVKERGSGAAIWKNSDMDNVSNINYSLERLNRKFLGATQKALRYDEKMFEEHCQNSCVSYLYVPPPDKRPNRAYQFLVYGFQTLHASLYEIHDKQKNNSADGKTSEWLKAYHELFLASYYYFHIWTDFVTFKIPDKKYIINFVNGLKNFQANLKSEGANYKNFLNQTIAVSERLIAWTDNPLYE